MTPDDPIEHLDRIEFAEAAWLFIGFALLGFIIGVAL